MKIWIDIDNPPQVQYLVPFVEAFRTAGAEVVVTARDYGETLELLAARGLDPHVVGRRFGASPRQKALGSLTRARRLASRVGRGGRPHALLCASRSSALAAAALRVRSYVLADYEHASVGVYRLTRSTFLHPESVDVEPWLTRGLRPAQLVPFRGLKEDVSFDGLDLDAIAPQPLPGNGEVKLLLRPPAEDSHYFAAASRELALALLERLAVRDDVRLVFAPRYARQIADVERLDWRLEPVVLRHPVPFVPLLKAVDLVVCSGGTMLREAAYLGVPAYSILRSAIGGVDRHLEALGRVRTIESVAGLGEIELRRRGPLAPLRSNPGLRTQLVELILSGR
jgi:uncharacterized protein